MIKHYFKIAIRNLLRYKGHTALNVSGLVLSLTCSLLIFMWVQDEYNINRFSGAEDQVYQVFRSFPNEKGEIMTRWACPFPVSDALVAEYPEIRAAAAYRELGDQAFVRDEKQYLFPGTMAHFSLFEVFGIELIEGSTTEADKKLKGIYISTSFAERLFGADWQGKVLGESLSSEDQNLEVLGVYQDLAANATLSFDFVTNIRDFAERNPRWSRWGSSAFATYIKLAPKADAKQLAPKIKDLVARNGGADNLSLLMQDFSDTYLYGNFKDGKVAGGRITYVRIFFFAALFLVLMACINFINLTTAHASRRAAEVGIRKVIGANRGSLLGQFLLEVGIVCFFSVSLALMLTHQLLPYANELLGKSLTLDLMDGTFWGLLAGVSLLVILLAGVYPSLMLSSFSIVNVLKNQLSNRWSSTNLRRALVVVQFVLSGLLMTSAVIVQQQISYIKHKDLGFDREQVIQLEIPASLAEHSQRFKSQLLTNPTIESVTGVLQAPIGVGRATDDLTWPGKDPNSQIRIHFLTADKDFDEVFKIEMAEGHFHRNDTAARELEELVINQAAAEIMNLENPVGTKVSMNDQSLVIVGIVKDFHTNSFHEDIKPLMIFNEPQNAQEFAIRYRTGQIPIALDHIKTTYAALNADKPLQYRFLDDQYNHMYRAELLIGKLANFFALVALFISCLGLLGLVSFLAQQKTKEIGIRKVLGASVGNIVALLSKDFLRLVVIAFVIATPLTIYLMQAWLSDFAFHIDLNWSTFILVGLGAVLLAFLTVSFQSVRAAITNPINSLRNE
ncbi:MAG: ABC transporter permease [Bacteroidota bacterium]